MTEWTGLLTLIQRPGGKVIDRHCVHASGDRSFNQGMSFLDLFEHFNAAHVRPILVDFIDHEVGARNQDGIGQAFAKIASPAGKRRVRVRNLNSDTLKTNHNGKVIIVSLLGIQSFNGISLAEGRGR